MPYNTFRKIAILGIFWMRLFIGEKNLSPNIMVMLPENKEHCVCPLCLRSLINCF